MIATENQAMSSTASITRPSYTEGALGNQLETWVAVGTVSCDIWPITRNKEEKSSGNQELAEGLYYISFPFDTDVRVTDKATISNVSYDIVFVPVSQSWMTNKRCEASNFNNKG